MNHSESAPGKRFFSKLLEDLRHKLAAAQNENELFDILVDIVEELRADLREARRSLKEAQRELAQLPETSGDKAAIPRGMLKSLIMLCHPDRHADSTLSNDVTKWLLAQCLGPARGLSGVPTCC